MTLPTLSPADARSAIAAGARLVDIRAPDEHARERIPGAVNMPLAQLGPLPQDGRAVIFHCKSGMRTVAISRQLAATAGSAPAYILDGGIDAWRGAASQPQSIARNRSKSCGRSRSPRGRWF